MAGAARAERGTRALRATHRAQVLDLLRTQGPLARSDVADRLALARSAVTPIVAELIDEGLLFELGPAPGDGSQPARGRPRVLVGCDPGAARVLAAQVGARWARVLLADAAGDVVASARADVAGATSGEVVERIAGAADDLLAANGGPPLTAAGICIPGAVDTTSGTVVRSEALRWRDVPLADLLGARLGVPVLTQDVTQAATIAEVRYGTAIGARHAVVVDYGARVSVGLVLDGRLHRGASGMAGSIGHVPVLDDDTPCRCGRRGCLEAVAGVRAMVPTGRRRHGPADEVAAFTAVIERMGAGDAATEAVVHRALDHGAHVAASLVALLDPEVVVLSGLIVRYPELSDRLLERIGRLVPPGSRGRCELRLSSLGVDAWVRGAILVALQALQPELRSALAGTDA
jgi:predicted NBD/HSP70 family sugar kinase